MESDKRWGEFITTASAVFEEKGVDNTTINDITSRMGVARSLFYHYFDDKNALVNAVIDERVDDFVAKVSQWMNQEEQICQRERIAEAVKLVREYLTVDDPFNSTADSKDNGRLLHQFTDQCAARLAKRYSDRWEQEGANAPSVRHPQESFYLVAVGIINLLNKDPNISDDVLVDLVADTLHIDCD